jgi:hypothetical protein
MEIGFTTISKGLNVYLGYIYNVKI